MNRGAQHALAVLESETRQHIASGHQAFVVSIYLMAGGAARYKMIQLQDAAQQLLLEMGLSVTGIDYREWEYTTFFEVRLPAAAHEPEKKCPWCAETIKAAAIRCRFCGADVSDSVPAEQTATHSEQQYENYDALVDGNSAQYEVALRFFATELSNVAGASIVGREQTLDERALLAPIGAKRWLSMPGSLHRCRALLRSAMEDAAQRSSWVEHDGMALPATWIEPYELLAQLGDNSPALIGLLEQYGT